MIASLSSNNGYNFGLKWSIVGCALALVYISACELIVPPDRSVPRYNTVNGAKHRPTLNPGGSGYQGESGNASRTRAVEQAYGGQVNAPSTSANPAIPLPAAPPSASANIGDDPRFPPAPQMNAAPRTQPQSQESGGFWNSLAFWRDDEKVTDAPVSARQRPVENQGAAGTTMAASTAPVVSNNLAPLAPDAYPDLHTAPEKPGIASVDDSRQRSLATKGELEADRSGALAAREQVLKDAAAEPSLLSNPPSAIANLPPPPAMSMAQAAKVEQVQTAAPVAAAPIAAAPVAAPNVAPRVASANGGSAFERLTQQPLATANTPRPVGVAPPPAPLAAPAPAPAPAMAAPQEPIRLTPPPMAELPPAPSPMPAPAPAPMVASAPAPTPANVPLSVPADAQVPLAPAAVNVNAAPPVASVPAPQMAETAAPGGLEPITLTPPGGMAAQDYSYGTPATGAAMVQPVTSQRMINSQSYLPQSRYAQRRN